MNKEKQAQLKHLIAGIITLTYGFNTFGAGDLSSSAAYLLIAIIFLIVAGLHKWMAEKFLTADVAFFLVEAVTLVYAGWHYKTIGRPYLFYAIAAVGVIYFIFSVTSLLSKNHKRKRRSHKRKKRRRSSLFEEKKPDDNNQLQ